jgi:hypothetical protein
MPLLLYSNEVGEAGGIMKHPDTLRRHENALRKLIDTSTDPAVQRIAQGMETALRWARMDVKGWPSMVEEAELLASFLRKEIGSSGNGSATTKRDGE